MGSGSSGCVAPMHCPLSFASHATESEFMKMHLCPSRQKTTKNNDKQNENKTRKPFNIIQELIQEALLQVETVSDLRSRFAQLFPNETQTPLAHSTRAHAARMLATGSVARKAYSTLKFLDVRRISHGRKSANDMRICRHASRFAWQKIRT